MDNNLSVLLEGQSQNQIPLLGNKKNPGANHSGSCNNFFNILIASMAKQSGIESASASVVLDEKKPEHFIDQQPMLAGAFSILPFFSDKLFLVPVRESVSASDNKPVEAGVEQPAVEFVGRNGPVNYFSPFRPSIRYFANDITELATPNLQTTRPFSGETALAELRLTGFDDLVVHDIVNNAPQGLAGPNKSDLYHAAITAKIVKGPFNNVNEPNRVQVIPEDVISLQVTAASGYLQLPSGPKQHKFNSFSGVSPPPSSSEITIEPAVPKNASLTNANSTIGLFQIIPNASEKQLVRFDTEGFRAKSYVPVLKGQFIETSQPGAALGTSAEIESGGNSIPYRAAVLPRYQPGIVKTAATDWDDSSSVTQIAAIAQNRPEVAETLLVKTGVDSNNLYWIAADDRNRSEVAEPFLAGLPGNSRSYSSTSLNGCQPSELNPPVVQEQIPAKLAGDLAGNTNELHSSQDNGNGVHSIFQVQALKPAQVMNNIEPSAQPIVRNDFSLAVSISTNESNQPVPPEKNDHPAANRTEIIAQIVENARLLSRPGNTEMTIRLKPEHLGELSLKVIVEKGGVSASFHTDNPEVRGIIEASIASLKQELTNQGLKVDNVGVYAGLEGDSSHNPKGYQPQPKPKNQPKRNIAEFSPVLEPVQLSAVLNSTAIDYRA